MKVYLTSLGCRLNEAELEIWAKGFRALGFDLAESAAAGDILVLNSCAVTGEAARKSRQQIRRLHQANPRAKLVVTGCYATLNETEAAQLLGVDLIVANRGKDDLVNAVHQRLNLSAMPALATEPDAETLFQRGRQRAFVKVQDGCRYRCGFCIVTVARGEERSRPLAEVVEEVNRIVASGIQEVVLTGVHLGGYGAGLGLSLADLIKAVLQDTEVKRLRLGSLEPWVVDADYLTLFENPRLLPHLHLPLQSGADSVLRRMNRRGKVSDFIALAADLRAQIPEFNITSDIIVGFPGETEREWQQTVDCVRQVGFGDLHIFGYSRRAGTKAAELPAQVPTDMIKQRSRQLHELARECQQRFWQRQVGRTLPVLWEGVTQATEDGRLLRFGYTPNYIRAATLAGSDPALLNRITEVAVTGVSDDYVLTTAPTELSPKSGRSG